MVFIGALVLFFRIKSSDNQTGTATSGGEPPKETVLTDTEVPAPSSKDKTAPPLLESSSLQTKTAGEERPAPGDVLDHEGGIVSQENLLDDTQNIPAITIPEGEGSEVLESVTLKPRPYSIYVGSYKDLEESETTERELLSNYLPAYVVPIEVLGSVSQSLFGVTQDGIWYRILVGNYASKEDARSTLGRMMKEQRPEGQPEIMRFAYTVECGRFLEDERAGKLTAELIQKNFFPYDQSYPTTDGKVLTRILVGCYFSEQGARPQKNLLEEKGFSCKIVQR